MTVRDNIREYVENLRASQGDSIPVEKVCEIVDGILGSVSGDLSGADLKIYHEIQSLADYIERTKTEVAQICRSEIKNEHLQIANNELDAIIAHTEEATGAILDSCESIEKLAHGLEGDSATALSDSVTKIYEACNFQDITGQRITRVIEALNHIEGKVAALVSAFGDAGAAAPKAGAESDKGNSAEGEEVLLNGPQLPEDAQSQEDIDKLLASFD